MRTVVVLVVCLACHIAESARAVSPESAARLSEMKRRVGELTMQGKDSKVKFATEPLFRYADPTRGVTDATMWRLGDKGRPQGILILENYEASDLPWSYEFTVTSEKIPERIVSPGWVWKPQGLFHKWTSIESAPAPHAKEYLRGRQEKQMVRKFRASEDWNGKTFELRLLPKAIARYEDEKAGIISGSIYVFSHGTNSELLMLLEAHRRDNDSPSWRACFVRAGAAKFDVEYDGSVFWGCGYDDGRSRNYLIAGLKNSEKSLVKK